MLDPHTTPIHVEYRQRQLLAEASHQRLVDLARRRRRGNGEPRPGAVFARDTLAWRPALFRIGAWLVDIGRRLQAVAEARVVAA